MCTKYKMYQYPRGVNKGGILKHDHCPTISTSSWQNNCFLVEMRVINPLKDKTNNGWHFEQNIYDVTGISRALKAGVGSGNIPKCIINSNSETMKIKRIRKPTPKECFRLMDVDEHQIDKLINSNISNTQLYKMAGNSIVVSCLEGIFRNLLCTHSDHTSQTS